METWDLERVDVQIRKAMSRAAQRVVSFAKEHDVSWRQEAYGAALEYLNEAYRLRSIWP